MNKKLVLAEKPSVGRDIARVLGCQQKGNGYIEGKEFIVTWAMGHLITLGDPEVYGEQYKTWRLEDLPILPNKLKKVVIKKSGKQFSVVKELLHRKEVNEIIIATDAGREGELVARWILEYARVQKPLTRVWISSVTDKAILQGFKQRKNGKAYEDLFASAEARAEADWIVGINASRALTCKFNAQLSCGRVQTPTLAMIAKREEEIRAFVPREYYTMQGTSKGVTFTWQDHKSKEIRIFDKTKAIALEKELSGKTIHITSVEKKPQKSYAPALYDLTELQRDGSSYYGFSAKETLNILQNLYEHHKIVTYPRTDSRYLTSDMVETLKERIVASGVGPYSKFAKNILNKPIVRSSHYINDAKVSDHHAIIPTEQRVVLEKLGEKERKIYDLILRRFYSVFMEPYQYESTSIKGEIGGEHVVAKGKRIMQMGYKELYLKESQEDKELMLPAIHVGDKLEGAVFQGTRLQTKPPAYFTEGTLLSAMENPTAYMQDKDKKLLTTLEKTGGLGTVATRADIIEKLFQSFLIEKKEQNLHITGKGKQLLELVPVELKSPDLTAQWELELSRIAEGKLSKQSFVHQMREYAMKVIGDITQQEAKFKHDNVTGNRCPDCGQYMLEVNGKKGKMLVCQSRECGHRETVAVKTQARCPQCHKRMELRGKGEGKIFVCTCGYREKLSAFEAKRGKGTEKVSKKDVQKYLKNQEKQEEEINPIFANAFAKLKDK